MENALRVLLALGGSTNALIHLTAVAGRLGIRIDLHRLNEFSDSTPVLVDLKPTGDGYMEDFHSAGGMPALLWELRDLLHLGCRDVTGTTLEQRLSNRSSSIAAISARSTNRSRRSAVSCRCSARWRRAERS